MVLYGNIPVSHKQNFPTTESCYLNAATYTIDCDLNDKINTAWIDGTTNTKKLEFQILPATLVVQSASKKATVGDFLPEFSSYTYTILEGKAAVKNDIDNNRGLSISLVDPNPHTSNGYLDIPGSYDIVPTISGSSNYNFIPINGTLTVSSPQLIPIPKGANLIYNGENQELMAIPSADAGYTATPVNSTSVDTNNISAIYSGTYQVELALTDPDSTKWSDGTVNNKTITFEIEKSRNPHI